MSSAGKAAPQPSEEYGTGASTSEAKLKDKQVSRIRDAWSTVTMVLSAGLRQFLRALAENRAE